MLSSTVMSPDGMQIAASQPAMQEKTLRLDAKVCPSVLKVDTHSLAFDDSLPGGEYWKEFTVWNLSEVPLSFSLDRCSTMRESTFQFTIESEESGQMQKLVAGAPVAVDGLSHVCVSVRFRPTEDSLGEENYTIEIENNLNSRNVEVISVLTIVTKERQADGLQVSRCLHIPMPVLSICAASSDLLSDCIPWVAAH